MQTICITNQKGGCGKTMTALNLSAGLARKGYQVLVVDLDPQGPIGHGLGASLSDELLPIAHAIREQEMDKIIVPSSTENLYVVPADESANPESLYKKPQTTLKRSLRAIKQPFDFVILDTPPNLDLFTINAIVAADWLILPCETDRECLLSLNRTLEVVHEYALDREDLDITQFYKILVTIYDMRSKVMNTWFDNQVAQLKDCTFETKVHKTEAFKKARAQGLTIFEYADRGVFSAKETRRAMTDIESLSEEVINHGQRTTGLGRRVHNA